MLFDDAEALAITEKSGYSIEDSAIKGGSGWWNSPTGKVRLYVGDSYVELMDVAFPTQTGQWLEIDVALSRFEGADFTQVKGIGLMTYASEKSNWVDNIRVEWDGDPYPGDVSGGDGNVSGGNVGGEPETPAYEDLSIGFKTEIYFDPKLQEMTRELEKTILTWQNPYTGTTLANDPCVAMYEINNEPNLMNTFGSYSGDNYEIKSEYEKNLFRSLFNEYLKNIYGTNDRLVQAWTAEGIVFYRKRDDKED